MTIALNYKWAPYNPVSFPVFPATQLYIKKPPQPPVLFQGLTSRLTDISNFVQGKTGGAVTSQVREVTFPARPGDKYPRKTTYKTMMLSFIGPDGKTQINLELPVEFPVMKGDVLPVLPSITAPKFTFADFKVPDAVKAIADQPALLANALNIINDRQKWFNNSPVAARSLGGKTLGPSWNVSWKEFAANEGFAGASVFGGTTGTKKAVGDTSFFAAMKLALDNVVKYTDLKFDVMKPQVDISKVKSLGSLFGFLIGNSLGELVGDGLGVIMGQFQSSTKVVVDGVTALPTAIGSFFSTQAKALSDGIGGFATDVTTKTGKFATDFATNVRHMSEDQTFLLQDVLSLIQKTIPGLFTYIITALQEDFKNLSTYLTSFVTGLVTAIVSDGTALQEAIKNFVTGIGDNITKNITGFSEEIKKQFTGALKTLTTQFNNLVEGAKAEAKILIADVKNQVEVAKKALDDKVATVTATFEKKYSELNMTLQAQIVEIGKVREDLVAQIAEVVKLKDQLQGLKDSTSDQYFKLQTRIDTIQSQPAVIKTIEERKPPAAKFALW